MPLLQSLHMIQEKWHYKTQHCYFSIIYLHPFPLYVILHER